MNQEKNLQRKVTVRDVALRAGVSDATVSRVFNNHTGISQENRQSVLDAAELLGYIPRKRAPRTSINNIVFCLRKLDNEAAQNPYFSQVLHGAQEECANREVSLQLLTVVPSATTINEVQRVVRQSAVDALLLVSLLDDSVVASLLELDLPTVLIEDYFGWLAADGVISDSFNGVTTGMHALFGAGHRQIAFIDGPRNHYQARMRYLAYRQALDDAAIPYDSDLVASGDLLVDGGYRAMAQILASGKPFTAVMCTNDNSAFGAIRALTDHGRRIPHDVSIIGHDDVAAAALVSPSLTTIRAQMADIGRLAVARLFERLTMPDLAPTLLLTQETLVERQSVRRL